jgi:hypothetical protein
MADIFISYAREDLESAGRLAATLQEQGWSVFWDRTIPAGKSWREVIGATLADARCIVVLWSQHSVDSHWVIEEADFGLRRRILIPAFIESAEPPFGFGSIQAADLSEWRVGRMERSSDFWAMLPAFSVQLRRGSQGRQKRAKGEGQRSKGVNRLKQTSHATWREP